VVCICDMGICPCPICLVKKADIGLLGTLEDMAQHQDCVCEDTPAHWKIIKEARYNVYVRGKALDNGKAVENLLKEHLYVLVEVSI
jgi:hypothetical protein